jgi:CBS domain-containing protein
MKAEEIMTHDVKCIEPDTTLTRAAELMRDLDVGLLPICENDRLAGTISDRDIVIRGCAEGKDPSKTKVRSVMSEGIRYGFADQDVGEIVQIMEKHQVHRLPLLNREKRLVGIIATADVARAADDKTTAEALRVISQPS